MYHHCWAAGIRMHADVNININLDSLLGELQRSLQRVICLVGAGLQNIDKINSDQLHIPTDGIQMSLSRSIGWDDQTVKKIYLQWVLANGFRDSIECLSMFLESAHKVLSFWGLGEKQKNGAQLTGADWNQAVHKDPPKFHRFGFPDKLDHLKEKHSIIFNEVLGSHVIGINKARNCLVHRGGIVSQHDLTSDNSLDITYRRMMMLLQNEDGTKELVIRQVVEKDSILAIKQQDQTISFDLGSQIKLSPKEFSDIIWCLFLFGGDLVQNMSKYGLQKGYVKEI